MWIVKEKVAGLRMKLINPGRKADVPCTHGTCAGSAAGSLPGHPTDALT